MQLHIISFDIPYPADYGGVIDVFYKIKALNALGIKITLHCFEYGERKKQLELEKYCTTVHYYKRSRSLFQQISITPFIVSTRKNKILLQNLLIDNAPILFEGLHTCGFINAVELKARKKFVRMHNIEWQYYFNLAASEKNILKKIFFYFESARLKIFEKKIIPAVEKIFFISPDDANYFLEKFKMQKLQTEIIFPFHHYVLNFPNFKNPKKYFFFHGNLSVPENENAVRDLVLNIFYEYSEIIYPLTVAGKSPSESLKKFLARFKNVKLIENPTEDYLLALSQQAAAHILYVEKSAGVKLKLIRALAENPNVIVHRNLLPNNSWADYCTVFYSWRDLKQKMAPVNFEKDSSEIFARREKLFKGVLNNTLNAQKMVEAIFY